MGMVLKWNPVSSTLIQIRTYPRSVCASRTSGAGLGNGLISRMDTSAEPMIGIRRRQKEFQILNASAVAHWAMARQEMLNLTRDDSDAR